MPTLGSDPRHNARIIVLQKLFERAFGEDSLSKFTGKQFSNKSLKSIDEMKKFDDKLVEKIFSGVVENQDKIDRIIEELAPQWPVSQIAKTDLQILRMAILEGFIAEITPERVAIDEAIELSKEFTNEPSRKFINGVLGNLIVNKDKFEV
ncbi:MAG: transcription antitermination factor NusB [Candidatus Dojkabacteria bacterium]